MQISLASILVNDQEHALRFYTDTLGFVKEHDIPMGEFRWLTVSSPDGFEGVELVLEATHFPPAGAYQKALYEAGIPALAFTTSDIDAEYQKLLKRGVRFRSEPQTRDPIRSVLFEDTCGNLINLVQPAPHA